MPKFKAAATGSSESVPGAAAVRPVPSETTSPIGRPGNSSFASDSATSVGLLATMPPSTKHEPSARFRGSKYDGADDEANAASQQGANAVPLLCGLASW